MVRFAWEVALSNILTELIPHHNHASGQDVVRRDMWDAGFPATISDPLDTPIGESRWYAVGYSERHSHEQKIIFKKVTMIHRSELNFHHIDGVCPWNSVVENIMKKLPNIDPRSTAEAWVEQLKLGSKRVRFESCWHKHVEDTPAYIPSRPIAIPEFF